MDLVDTNIFLEILFQQNKSPDCEHYLRTHYGKLYFSTFSLHSIGVLLFKKKQVALFDKFLKDFPPGTLMLPISNNGYSQLSSVQSKYNLDYDDSFQFQVASENNLRLVTMDMDFKKTVSDIQVMFL
ncbi:MAG: PIN domain-containing protein [Lewinellaceae bacterium]|nr:PIN domain-containing protein [Saprospiraceae bacterium]MCB9341835.1 PIN domain-containing protein [Lewinellaceae bacterium]